ncbi:MAG: phage tail tube protein [Pikeienuella sp.]
MAGFNGRELTFDWDSTTLVGVRTRGVAANNSLVDVTTDDDAGWRTLLGTPGLKSIDITLSGITSDEIMIAEFFNAAPTGETLQADLPSSLASPGNFSGTFMLQALETSGDHDGAVEFSMTLQSSGAVTYTASSA